MSSMQNYLPYFVEGTVVAGFGRGSKELGIPTANFPEEVIHTLPANFECGVYYGWAKISNDDNVYKMVMCVGWNPYYHNTVKTMETHIIHKFGHDFYGDHLKAIVLGYIRPMCDFESLDALITAIHNDIAVANKHLTEPVCLKYAHDPFFTAPPVTAPSTAGNSSTVSAQPAVLTKPDLTQHCQNEGIGLLNGDIQSFNHVTHNHTQNGIIPSLHPDSSKLDKCDGMDSKRCENSLDSISRLSKDESCYSQNQQKAYHADTGSSAIPTKFFISQESEIISNYL